MEKIKIKLDTPLIEVIGSLDLNHSHDLIATIMSAVTANIDIDLELSLPIAK